MFKIHPRSSALSARAVRRSALLRKLSAGWQAAARRSRSPPTARRRLKSASTSARMRPTVGGSPSASQPSPASSLPTALSSPGVQDVFLEIKSVKLPPKVTGF
jgi:hypothetical protein